MVPDMNFTRGEKMGIDYMSMFLVYVSIAFI